MNILRNMKVRTKLISCFMLITFLTIIVGASNFLSLSKIGRNSENMSNVNLPNMMHIAGIQQNLTNIRVDMFKIVYERDSSIKIPDVVKDIQTNEDAISTYMKKFEQNPMTSEEKKQWELCKSQYTEHISILSEICKSATANDFASAEKEFVEKGNPTKTVKATLTNLINLTAKDSQAIGTKNSSLYHRTIIIIAILLLAEVAAAIILAAVLSLNIATPLKLAAENLNTMAKGDFSLKVPEKFLKRKDEIGKLCTAVNTMQQDLVGLIKKIIDNSQKMNASSQELSATVQELTSKAEKINSAVKKVTGGIEDTSAASEEITASIEEVDSSITELSSKASDGSTTAGESKERANAVKENGQKSIDAVQKLYTEKQAKMVKAIENGKVVDKIKDMADTIASIAKQTNLLALNAAIEAARAGESGKGFAVVAEEVRTLAEQSSQAVSGIQDTIQKVQTAFANLSSCSSEVLQFINDSVNPKFKDFGDIGNKYYNDADFVSKFSEEIAAMSEELTATMNQVSQATQNMAQSAQKSSEHTETIRTSIDETTKAIEKVSSASQNQAKLAESLNEMVEKFKIN